MGLILVHGIADVPFTAESVHQLHDVDRLGVGHLARLEESVGECLAAGAELIFVAGNLLWYADSLDVGAVGTIDGDSLRIVDVVDDEVAISSGNDTDVVTNTLRRGLHVGKDAIGENDGDGVCEVHAGVALDGKTIKHADVAISKHSYEVEGIDTEVE